MNICRAFVYAYHTWRVLWLSYTETQASSEHGFVFPGGSVELLILGTSSAQAAGMDTDPIQVLSEDFQMDSKEWWLAPLLRVRFWVINLDAALWPTLCHKLIRSKRDESSPREEMERSKLYSVPGSLVSKLAMPMFFLQFACRNQDIPFPGRGGRG